MVCLCMWLCVFACVRACVLVCACVCADVRMFGYIHVCLLERHGSICCAGAGRCWSVLECRYYCNCVSVHGVFVCVCGCVCLCVRACACACVLVCVCFCACAWVYIYIYMCVSVDKQSRLELYNSIGGTRNAGRLLMSIHPSDYIMTRI